MLESMLKICIYTGINADVTLEDNGRTTECEDRAILKQNSQFCFHMSIHRVISSKNYNKGRVQKKILGKVWSFTKPGGGVAEGNEKTKLLFWKSIFSVSM